MVGKEGRSTRKLSYSGEETGEKRDWDAVERRGKEGEALVGYHKGGQEIGEKSKMLECCMIEKKGRSTQSIKRMGRQERRGRCWDAG